MRECIFLPSLPLPDWCSGVLLDYAREILDTPIRIGALLEIVLVAFLLSVCAARAIKPIRIWLFRKNRRTAQGKHITGTQFLRVARKVSEEGVFGLDIGGTLAKVVYLAPKEADNSITSSALYGDTGEREESLEFDCSVFGGTLHFIRFESLSMDAGLSHWQKIVEGNEGKPVRLYATGGGAFKYAASLQMGTDFHKVDELESMVEGFRTLVKGGPAHGEVYSLVQGEPVSLGDVDCTLPCIVVNIGSGVSIMRLHNRRFERIGGTSAGGGTFLALCRMLTEAETFEEAMALCAKGNSQNVDKLVRDIYGGDYAQFGLKGDICASSLGKLATMIDPKQNAKQEDLAIGILNLITQQISLLAINLAKLHRCKERVFFVGGFLSYNDTAKRMLSSASEFQGVRAHFLHHADYLGAVGALVRSLDEKGRSVDEGGAFAKQVKSSFPSLFPPESPIAMKPSDARARPEGFASAGRKAR